MQESATEGMEAAVCPEREAGEADTTMVLGMGHGSIVRRNYGDSTEPQQRHHCYARCHYWKEADSLQLVLGALQALHWDLVQVLLVSGLG